MVALVVLRLCDVFCRVGSLEKCGQYMKVVAVCVLPRRQFRD